MTDLSNRKPILCLDFDGVCHSYTSGWKGAAVIPDPPVPGLATFLEDALEHFEVDIFSSRSHQAGGIAAMREWFHTHHMAVICGQLKFPTEKPPAFVSLDDRVLTFTGVWPSIESLREFKPWNAKGV